MPVNNRRLTYRVILDQRVIYEYLDSLRSICSTPPVSCCV